MVPLVEILDQQNSGIITTPSLDEFYLGEVGSKSARNLILPKMQESRQGWRKSGNQEIRKGIRLSTPRHVQHLTLDQRLKFA